MPERESPLQNLFRIVSPELIKTASAITGFRLTKPQFGSAANISGIRTQTLTFSQRHDSLTVFASDNRYGHRGKAGAWTGSDRTAITACRRLLRAAKVPAKEIADIQVVSEMGQVAERVSEKEFRTFQATVLRKFARARRAIDGVPVWSSYTTVGLNEEGKLGWLELHWPEIPLTAVKEAKVLQSLVKRGFKAPDLPGARVETVVAGLLHSPAIGFFMDVTAAIRVIYSVQEPGIGRKPVLYLDRHGSPIPLPRDIVPKQPVESDRSRPGPRSAG